MFLAFVEGKLLLARQGLTALCPECGEEVLPKCGEIIQWHWAHHPDSKCPYVGGSYTETMWHQQWKAYADPANREVTVTRDGRTHRADIMVRGDPDVACEIQYSQISPEDIESRNEFWQNIMWIFHAVGKDYQVEYNKEWAQKTGMAPYSIHRSRGWPQIVVAFAGLSYLHKTQQWMAEQKRLRWSDENIAAHKASDYSRQWLESFYDQRWLYYDPMTDRKLRPALVAQAQSRVALDLGEGEVFVVHKMNYKGNWACGTIVSPDEIGRWIAGSSSEPQVPIGMSPPAINRPAMPNANRHTPRIVRTSSGDRNGVAYESSGGCPLCSGSHAGCRFTAGSLFCVVDQCTNPHHRSSTSFPWHESWLSRTKVPHGEG